MGKGAFVRAWRWDHGAAGLSEWVRKEEWMDVHSERRLFYSKTPQKERKTSGIVLWVFSLGQKRKVLKRKKSNKTILNEERKRAGRC